MGYNNYITKNQSQIVYGIAILLMVFHHMFAFPDRIQYNWTGVFYYSSVPIEVILAAFGRICIAIYAYMSGYGMMIKNFYSKEERKNILSSYSDIFKKLVKFYSNYWIVFIIFVPIGFLFFDYKFNLMEFIKNLLGLSCTYNAEWWYVWQYVRMLLLFPLIKFLIRKFDKLRYKKFFYALVFIMSAVALKYIEYNGFWLYLFCFVEGMLVSYYKLDKVVFLLKEKLGRVLDVCIIIGLLGVIFIRLFILGGEYDYIFVLLFIYGCLILLENKVKIISKIRELLAFLGRYSIYIWLTHTFFIYYYFQKIVYSLRLSILIYIVTVVGLLIIAVFLDQIKMKIVDKKY